ncbi:MAG TPA: DNA-binding protein [Peptococcaceae bacterium]|nr:DNA-binding protein [Peptococcaceae bacterium]
MLTPSLEDYLEEVYRFSLTNENIRVTDISNKLSVSLPSVSKALMKLKEKGYILYKPYGTIELTEKGKERGSFLVARNRLLQEFLALICVRCDFAAEAEAVEHYLSKETVTAIQILVNFFKDNPEIYQKFIDYNNFR